jgi:hypothetical protein
MQTLIVGRDITGIGAFCLTHRRGASDVALIPV